MEILTKPCRDHDVSNTRCIRVLKIRSEENHPSCSGNPALGQEALSSTLPHYPSMHRASALGLVYLAAKVNGGKRSHVSVKRCAFFLRLCYSHFVAGVIVLLK